MPFLLSVKEEMIQVYRVEWGTFPVYTWKLIPTKTVFKACLQRLEHFSPEICYWADPNTEVRERGRDRGQERQQVVDQQILSGSEVEGWMRRTLERSWWGNRKTSVLGRPGQVLRKRDVLSPNRWWRLQSSPSTESFLLVFGFVLLLVKFLI